MRRRKGQKSTEATMSSILECTLSMEMRSMVSEMPLTLFAR